MGMKQILPIVLALCLSGCATYTPPEPPPQKFEVGDVVKTTIPGLQVHGVVFESYHEQYWADGWSHRVKYLNKIGNVKREWFSETELELINPEETQ